MQNILMVTVIFVRSIHALVPFRGKFVGCFSTQTKLAFHRLYLREKKDLDCREMAKIAKAHQLPDLLILNLREGCD